ncbi:hypothetical protein EJB05_53716, partial [Eragrostis curvula]
MASRREPSARSTTVRNLPDHILRRVFLCLASSVDLVRAASACKKWRRVVADPGFLVRFRSLHAGLVAGHYHTVDPFYDESVAPSRSRRPVFLPSPTLTVDRRRFSLDFLPETNVWKWKIADSRGSLLLLASEEWTRWKPPTCFYPDLVVCEPLTRRHQFILLPERLKIWSFGFFLLDGDASGGRGVIGMSSFRVVAALYKHSDEPMAAVFTSGHDGGWRLPAGKSASRISLDMDPDDMSFLGRANGSLYWGTVPGLLALDEATLEFSQLELPDEIMDFYDRRGFRVLGGEDGALRVVLVEDNELKVFRRVQDSDEWLVEKTVRLLEATRRLPRRKAHYFRNNEAMIIDADTTNVLMTPEEETWLFSVELETMEAERKKGRNRFPGPAYPCELPWPPVLEACPARVRRRRSCRGPDPTFSSYDYN